MSTWVTRVREAYAAGLAADGGVEEGFGPVSVDVAPDHWRAGLLLARDVLGCTYFDWLSAVDEADPPGFRMVCHLAARRPGGVDHLLVRTLLPGEAPVVESVTPVFAGAGWHERETFEMFGVTFDGHPNLVPLLLPDGFEGHPLRKEFVLASRVAKEWPGAREPGEGPSGGPVRRRMRPPGVPDPADWGPEAVREEPQ